MTQPELTPPSAIHLAKNIIILIIPCFFSLVLSQFLKSDSNWFFMWWISLMVLSIGILPFCIKIFGNTYSLGYSLAKPLGLLLPSILVWTLSYLKIAKFNQIWIIISLILLYAFSWGNKKLRQNTLAILSKPSALTSISIQECLFLFIFFFWTVVRGITPYINGEEKFMDYAFLNVMVRSDNLPALDPWLAGKSINYYYFGQYLFAFLTKFNRIPNEIAYNLSISSVAALTFSLAYSVGQMVFETGTKMVKLSNSVGKKVALILSGILSGLMVTLLGNSHAFYYTGRKILGLFQSWGINVGKFINEEGFSTFFYPDSTRFIGHNPNSLILDEAQNITQLGDYTIHEFPVYSYLIGDLHAHMISLIIVLSITALLWSFYRKIKYPLHTTSSSNVDRNNLDNHSLIQQRFFEILGVLLCPEIILSGILLGVAMMCNYWDFLIYFIVISMVLLISFLKKSKIALNLPSGICFILSTLAILLVYMTFSSHPILHIFLQILLLLVIFIFASLWPTALTSTSAAMSFFFIIPHLIALPFNLNFTMISNSIAPTEIKSALYQLWIVWQFHVLFAVIIIVTAVLSSRHKTLNWEKTASVTKLYPHSAIGRFLAKLNPGDIFMSGLSVIGLLLILAPELFYVQDIYGGSYKRSNTMFKFTFAAFVILGLVISYTISTLWLKVYRKFKSAQIISLPLLLPTLALSLLFIVPLQYPLKAIPGRIGGEFTLDRYKQLDGTLYIHDRVSPSIPNSQPGVLIPYLNGINWLNKNVEQTVNICEAYGDSYTDFCIVSAYTGLPTIFGWQTHQWLWRFQGILDEKGLLISDPQNDVWANYITPRQNDIKTIYTSNDPVLSKTLLDKYDITYLILGDLERTQFRDGEASIVNDDFVLSLGTVAFQSESFYIIQVKGK